MHDAFCMNMRECICTLINLGGATQWENTEIETILKYNRKGQKTTLVEKRDQSQYECTCYVQRN